MYHQVYDDVTDFEISGFQKKESKYLENKTFFLQIKKFINFASRATSWQKLVL